jgi:hypothetical protein
MAKVQWGARHFVGGIGLGLLGALICLAGLRFVPSHQLKIKVLDFLVFVLDLACPKANAPSPDPPVVVRGGSLNFFGNTSSWHTATSAKHVYQSDIGTPTSLDLDGVVRCNNAQCTFPTSTTLTPLNIPFPAQTANWGITLTMRGGNASIIAICSHLIQDGTGSGNRICDRTPTSSIGSDGVYFQRDASDKVADGEWDGRSLGARKHYVFKSCQLSHSGTAGDDLDPACDKINTLTVSPGENGSASSTYLCLDGACDVTIDNK